MPKSKGATIDLTNPLSANLLRIDLGNPVAQVVVVGDTGNFAIANIEEGPGWQAVSLAIGFGQTFVGIEVFTQYDEFGGSAAAIVVGHDDHVDQLLTVVMIHFVHEFGKGGLALFTLALVDVVNHIVGQQAQKRSHVAVVEGFVIVCYQLCGLLLHGCGPLLKVEKRQILPDSAYFFRSKFNTLLGLDAGFEGVFDAGHRRDGMG